MSKSIVVSGKSEMENFEQKARYLSARDGEKSNIDSGRKSDIDDGKRSDMDHGKKSGIDDGKGAMWTTARRVVSTEIRK